MKARRVEFSEPSKVSVGECEVNDQPGWGEALLKVSHSLLSPGTELSILAGHKGPARGIGYTAVGTILKSGGGIDAALMGKPLFLFPAFDDQKECHASHKLANRDAILLPLPDGLDPAKACFARLVNVAMTPFSHLPPRVQGTALVVGLGVVGNLAAQVARLHGFEVIAVDTDAVRRRRAKETGAHHVLDPADGSLEQHVKNLTAGQGANLTINATGAASTFMSAIAATAAGGEFSALGGARGDTMVNLVDLYHHIQWRHVTLRGAWEMTLPRRPVPADQTPSTEQNLRIALRWLRDDTINLQPLWTHTLPADRAPEAYAALARADPGYLGVVFEWR